MAQGAEFPETNTGPLYVTLSGAFNPDSSATVVSTHTLSMEESQGAIKAEQLQAIKDLHAATCAPSQAKIPVFGELQAGGTLSWTRQSHMTGMYRNVGSWAKKDIFNTTGGEQVCELLASPSELFASPSDLFSASGIAQGIALMVSLPVEKSRGRWSRRCGLRTVNSCGVVAILLLPS